MIASFHDKISDLKKMLIDNNNLGMLLIDVSTINRIEHDYGRKMYGEILEKLKKVIIDMRAKQIRKADIITMNHLKGDQFYIFLSKKRKEKSFQSGDIESLATRVSKHINETMFFDIYQYLRKRPKINVGYSIVIRNPLIQEERIIDKLISDSKKMAEYEDFRSTIRNKEKLQEIIIKEEIRTIYQPIVNCTSNTIIGYEALSRGPENTEYENPIVLFIIAEETDLVFELDRLCRRLSIINAKGIPKYKKLFINILPSTIHDPEFKGHYLEDFLKDIKISPRSIVLEVSERQAIDNYDLFKEASNYYSEIGFAIAIDDTGTGYSNLKSLVELNIEYIKIDMSLIRNINIDPLKKTVVNAVLQIGNSLNSQVIAEGIETKEELVALKEIGINYGQGFLYAKPASPFPKINLIEK